MTTRAKSLFEEQQQLPAGVKESIERLGASKIFGAAISVMNILEGVLTGSPRERVITDNPDKAWAAGERLLVRLQSGDEKNPSNRGTTFDTYASLDVTGGILGHKGRPHHGPWRVLGF